MRKIAFIAIIVFLVVCFMQAGNGFCQEEGFDHYKIKRGETLSEISWAMGVPMKQLVQWNPQVMDQGIRNLEPGTVLKYKTPDQVLKEVKQGQEKTRQDLAGLRQKVDQENQKFLESLELEGEQTRKEVREINQDQSRVLGRIEGKVDQMFHMRGDIYGLTLAIGAFILMLLVAIIATFYFLMFRNKPQSQQEGKSSEAEGQTKEVFNQDKLNELEKVKLTPGSEQEVEFALNSHKFKALLRHDGQKYQTWQLENGTAEFKKFGRKRDAVKSIKQSLKHYLMGTPSPENRIEEAIQGGKIKKI